MSKLKFEENLLLCQICIGAKQCQNLSYKLQSLVNNICKELHVDFIDLITPANPNNCRYALIITNSRSRYCWVEDLHEKREVGLLLRKLVTFIEN